MTHPRSFEPVGATVTGYDRAALEQYFTAVDQERRRLHAEIAVARTRVARARAALDARRVLVTMVERAVDEITAKRRQADLVVGRFAAVPAPPDRVAAATPVTTDEAPRAGIRWQPPPAAGPEPAPSLAEAVTG